MKLFRLINNSDLDLALIKHLAREAVSVEHVDKPDAADVIVILEKGKGFGVDLDQVEDILKLDKPKVVACTNGFMGDGNCMVLKPTLLGNGRSLQIKVSDIAAAILAIAPPEFEVVDDIDEPAPKESPKVSKEMLIVDDTVPQNSLADRMALVLSQMDVIRAEKSIGIKPCKGGVGATTLAACLTDALSELGAVHVEPAGTGRIYYDAPGRYFESCPDAKLAILDGEFQGDLRIVVTDDSMMSFNALKALLDAGDVPDIVVINRMRGGLFNSVFKKEFPQVEQFFTVVDNYKACIDGQEAEKVPTSFSPDMAQDIGRLAAKVRELLDI